MPHPSGRPWIVAHQGASRRAAPNTIAAFRLAADLGADAVELDARRTADGVIVVHHDAWIRGSGRPIVAMTRREVADIAPAIPDLSEALDACRPMWVDVEIKNDPGEPDFDPDDLVLAGVADLVDSRTLVSSFNASTAARAHQMGLATGLLLDPGASPIDALDAWPGHRWLLPERTAMIADPAGVVRAAHAAGAEVGVWTVDDPVEMETLAMAGVGFICTNEPDSALGVLA